MSDQTTAHSSAIETALERIQALESQIAQTQKEIDAMPRSISNHLMPAKTAEISQRIARRAKMKDRLEDLRISLSAEKVALADLLLAERKGSADLIETLNEQDEALSQAQERNEALAFELHNCVRILNEIAEANIFKDKVLFGLVDLGRSAINRALKEHAR